MIKKVIVLISVISLLRIELFAQKEDAILISQDSLHLMIGQMILIGVGDDDYLDKSNPVFDAIEQGKVGSIILFEKNISFENPKKHLKEIVGFAQKKSKIPLFVSIDQEGGRVNRLKPRYGFPKSVSAEYLGSLNNLDSTRYYAELTAKTLHSLGINMNFAPSVDVNINPQSPAIGKMERSFSAEHQLVSTHAAIVVETHKNYNIGTTLKHFPGHGSSQSDTHLGIADVTNNWKIDELYPYKALIDAGSVSAIMTAHIVNGVLDKTKTPATLSKPIVDGLLRGFLGYQGVVFSDDMQMQAIASEHGLEEAIKESIMAGVDILLFANNVPDYQLVTANQIFDIIQFFVSNGDIPESIIKASFDRIMKLKRELGLLEKDYTTKLNNRLKKN
ncbi:MAG: beta-N-acetylhexosaminidase [Cyclobacteriaceae bacterium]|jgi:beta-N-acetylhexosaminidase